MELFPAQPDLSLQLCPPNKKSTQDWRRKNEDDNDEMDLGFWERALDSRNTTISSMANQEDLPCFELSLSNPRRVCDLKNTNNFHLIQNGVNSNNLIHPFQQQLLYNHFGYLRPIRGIPVYQNPPPFPLINQQVLDNTSVRPSSNSNASFSSPYASHQGLVRSRFLPRFPGKRSMRAPRMRWTTTLHARFVHAVELLGGHERATPKSVLELMDVKDLTLAHVKSHLQMYRTVKTTDKAAASSGQSDLFENGSSGVTSEDLGFDIHTPKTSDQSVQKGRHNVHQEKGCYGLWGNSSREAWLNGKANDSARNMQQSLEKDMEGKCSSYDRISEVSSSSLSETTPEKPNLEFTLGMPL